MTDYKIKLEPGTYIVTGTEAQLRTAFSVEAWQFFAFVFAASITLAFPLLDELPRMSTAYRVILKVMVFVGLAYLTLFCPPIKDFIIRALSVIKTKGSR
jgi:bacteriorhodopsin